MAVPLRARRRSGVEALARMRPGAGCSIACIVCMALLWLVFDWQELEDVDSALDVRTSSAAASDARGAPPEPPGEEALDRPPPPSALAGSEAAAADDDERKCFAALASGGWEVFRSEDACVADAPVPLAKIAALEDAADLDCDALYRCPGLAYCNRETGDCGFAADASTDYVQATLNWAAVLSLLSLAALGAPFFVLRRLDPPEMRAATSDAAPQGAPKKS